MTRPLRILHTESSMNMGGQEMRILLEMEQLAPLGFESWLAARQGSAILDETRRRGLRAVALPLRNRFDPASMATLWRLMKRERIDIVNAHGSRDAWNAFLVARWLGIATVRSRHIANPIRRHFLGQLVYGALCDRVLTTSESIRTGLIEAGIDEAKIVSIPTGVDVEKYASARRDGRLRRELGIPQDAPLLGMISILRSDKGPDVFLEACDRLLAGRGNLWCVLVGDGIMRGQIERQQARLVHRDRVVIAGFRRDIPQVLAELDVLALPARLAEGVPQVILQAHAARVPVVATRVGGIAEVAREDETAFTVPPGDVAALACALACALDQRSRALKQAERGKAMVDANYSLPVLLERMDSLYRSMVKA